MSKPAGPAVRLPDGRVIDHCKARIRIFVERDAYVDYDHKGRSDSSMSDRFTQAQLQAVNRAMRARSSTRAWIPFIDQPLPELSSIPSDLDLIDSSESEVEDAHKALFALIRRIVGEKWLTDMAASKMLFLLRPRFIAISDSYVRDRLDIRDSQFSWTGNWRESYATRMLVTQQSLRSLGQANAEALAELSRYANSLVLARVGFPDEKIHVQLSKVRILDILLWTDEAYGNNPVWIVA